MFNDFEGMKLTEFLEKIGKFSFVFGFRPILSFFFINLKVPTFFNYKLFFLILLTRISIRQSIKLIDTLFEKPIFLLKNFDISNLVKFFLFTF